NGRTVARENFGCRGTFTPHASDLWAPAWLRAPRTYWGCSVGGAGWMAQHYMHHFEFTQDTSFLLDRAMPAIRQVAQFYSDWIIEDPRDGTLISAPSTSPENQYIDASGQKVASCLGSAMDQQIIAEVFDHYIRCCEVLQRQDDLLREVQKQLPKLRPGFVIGSDGRILEWDRPYDEPEPGHRHMSHLYGFHPGTAVSSDDHPEIYQAVRTTLQHRLANGGAGTGWSRAWLINCSARLKDGEMAHDHIKELFKKSMYDNLFDAHPPFQIDGNFGYTAGVAEMLIQSHENKLIRLLPALPTSWSTGQVTGLKARGAHEVDIHWKNNTLWKAIITSKNDDVITLAYDGRKYKVKVKKDKPFVFEPFKN
ncbi:MAG: glycoside hydrolase family 95 protein, partial [Cyclobacteriaceae bacterium]|nr:glycoside hydrolase family 95 protein [Cyclobacteriaceae bacterium HetDA_MAG_MS6]